MQGPEQIYGELFDAVQSAGIFPDSKTFVDCTPRQDPELILKAYNHGKAGAHFDLRKFVLEHFELPKEYGTTFQSVPSRPVEEHIGLLWDVLRRDADRQRKGSSLIPLPFPYIVPGGRFGEIYYWDSYFTILGLLTSGQHVMAKHMLANFAYLIDSVGHIPNGNRTYFLSRSQPPFFAMMVHEVAHVTGDASLYATYVEQVRSEYTFWMSCDANVTEDRRVVQLSSGEVLNRYWDDLDMPRQESYIEDVELALSSGREPSRLYRDIRAACESGWDFSARWCGVPDKLDTIRTTDILPVDLNCLLWAMEYFLGETYAEMGDQEMCEWFRSVRRVRAALCDAYFWDDQDGIYRDYNFVEGRQTQVVSLAMIFPLFMRMASQEQADRVAEYLRRFLKPGGLVTTLHHTGQQWDAPNGWAPLQWIAYRGLQNYGHYDFAAEIARRWIANVTRVYRNTGKLVEKYNVEDISLAAGGGEYPVQDGFGWTNGVLLKMITETGSQGNPL